MPSFLDFSTLQNFSPVLVKDSADLKGVVDFCRRTSEFGFDCETNVVKSHIDRKVRTIQIGNRSEQYVIDLLHFAGSTKDLMGQGWMKTPAWAEGVVSTLRPFLESREYLKLGVNLQFDYESVFWGLGLRPWWFYDCQLVEKVLNAGKVFVNTSDFFAMDDMFPRYTGLSISKELQKSFDLETELTHEQIQYAGFDTRAPFPIRTGQQKRPESPSMQRAFDLENHAIPAFGDMHLWGFFLDRQEWLSLDKRTRVRHEGNVSKLDEFFVPVVGERGDTLNLTELEGAWRAEKDKETRAKYRARFYSAKADIREGNKWEGKARINYSASGQLSKALIRSGHFTEKDFKDPKKKDLSTDDNILRLLVNRHDVIKAIQAFRETHTKLKTFGESYAEYIDAATGRIHSKISQIGADTGRTSSASPNVQNVPKEPEYRLCFRAQDDDWVLITIDMSGAEFRILAAMSQDPVLITAFKNGWDAHSYGAEIIFGEQWKDGTVHEAYTQVEPNGTEFSVPKCGYYYKDHAKCKCPVHKRLRDQIKAINFGIMYGTEADSLAETLGIDKVEAKRLLAQWRATFKVAWALLVQQGKDAKMQLFASTFSGRRRNFNAPTWDKANERAIEDAKRRGRLPTQKDVERKYFGMWGHIERQGKNTPYQGGNGDVIKLAMGCGFDKNGEGFMWHRLWPEFGAKIVNLVHDENIIECHKDRAVKCRDFIGDCFTRAGAEFMENVDMEWEANINREWSK